jgi:PDZ domain-containing protein
VPPWRNVRLVAVITAVILLATIVRTATVALKWDVIAPGDARRLDDLISVKSKDAAHPVTTYVPTGRVLYTTVSIEQRVNGYQALWAYLHSDYELIEEQKITGNKPEKEVEQINRAEMDESKIAAEVVALRRLHYPVDAHGDGAEIMKVSGAKTITGTLRQGDVIVAIDGKPVLMRDDVSSLMAAHKPGDQVRLSIRRNGATSDVIAATHADTEDPKSGRALIGVNITTANFRYDVPLDINIDTGLVGGPSAGLAFTLGLLDILTPGDLTGGKHVAVTGTIDTDENVGPIGGVAQKAVAARHQHAAAFIVPVGEEKDARKHAGKMKVIPVKNLSDALAALERLGGNHIG